MKSTTTLFSLAAVVCSLFTVSHSASAQGTAFTYQGFLTDQGAPANGAYDLEFRLFDAVSGGAQQGGTVVSNLFEVTNGLFTVTLNPGAGVFTGAARWLNVAARPGASMDPFTNLVPRQPITAAPYAVFAGNAATAATASSVAASNLTGTVPLAQLPGAVVTNAETGVTLSGTFTGNGAGLTGLNAPNLVGTVADAQLSTNVALRAGGNTFSGIQQVTDTIFTGAEAVDQQQLTSTGSSGATDQWQSFTSGLPGALTKIAVFASSPFGLGTNCPGTIRIYAGEGTAGTLLATESVTILGIAATYQAFAFAIPPRVQAGSKYTIRITIPPNWVFAWLRVDTGNPYAGGVFAVNGILLSTEDIRFQTYVTPATTGNILSVIPGSGNVGIGTTTPGNKLDVSGIVRAFGVNPNLAVGDNTPTTRGEFALAAGGGAYSTDAVANDVVIRTSGGKLLLQSGFGASAIAIAANNNVGIGTAAPTQAKLVVSGAVATSISTPNTYLDPNSYGQNAPAGPWSLSIYADSRIGALGIFCFSDARIKQIEGRSDAAQDLATILGIEVTDYTYLDRIGKGAGKQKKVIAQQVEAVFPQAVSKSTDVVPDIYQKARQQDGWVQLATDLKVGERVKLIGEQAEGIHEVLEVKAGAFRTAFKPATDKVFVYGREVKDYRSVDYEAIAMLNVSATQELARKVQAQEAELNALRAEKAALADQLAGIEKAVAQLTAESRSAKLAAKSTPTAPPTAAGRKTLTTASAKD